MSYKAFASLKESVELDTIKEMSPEQINNILNKLYSENKKMKTAIEESRRYLDSFIETEGSKDHYIESTGEYENCQIDFNEAQKALDLLGCDDGHGFDNAL